MSLRKQALPPCISQRLSSHYSLDGALVEGKNASNQWMQRLCEKKGLAIQVIEHQTSVTSTVVSYHLMDSFYPRRLLLRIRLFAHA